MTPIIRIEQPRPGFTVCNCCGGSRAVMAIVLGQQFDERTATSQVTILCDQCRSQLFHALRLERQIDGF